MDDAEFIEWLALLIGKILALLIVGWGVLALLLSARAYLREYQVLKILNIDLLDACKKDDEDYEVLKAMKYQEQEQLLKYRAFRLLKDIWNTDPAKLESAQEFLLDEDTHITLRGLTLTGWSIFFWRKKIVVLEGVTNTYNDEYVLENPPRKLKADIKRLLSIWSLCGQDQYRPDS
jgi:hypothetical protein